MGPLTSLINYHSMCKKVSEIFIGCGPYVDGSHSGLPVNTSNKVSTLFVSLFCDSIHMNLRGTPICISAA